MKYDIFISYRRKESSGRSNVPMARTFKLEFERRGYKVFFDYSECTDNYFSETILPAIRTCNYFVLILTEDSMSRCFNENDWVRREIEEALAYNRKIIPITPDKECGAWPNLPDSLTKLDGLQITTIYTDHMFEDCVGFLLKNRFHFGEGQTESEQERVKAGRRNRITEVKERLEGMRKANPKYRDRERIKTRIKPCGSVKPKFKLGICIGIVVVLIGLILLLVFKSEDGCYLRVTRKGDDLVFAYRDLVCDFTYIMKCVEGGTFEMGSNDIPGAPAHDVTVSSFYIGETEVTQLLWTIVMGNNPSNWNDNSLPVECVSWEDSQEFIRKFNSMTGMNFRLPTEAEWEYAARGGNKSRGFIYSGDDDIDKVGWNWQNSGDVCYSEKDGWDFYKNEANNCRTHKVKTKSPNELGIYDMSGNVFEWCSDWYHWNYDSHSLSNPQGPSEGSEHVKRGGCMGSTLDYCRVTRRSSGYNKHKTIGFRLALSQ